MLQRFMFNLDYMKNNCELDSGRIPEQASTFLGSANMAVGTTAYPSHTDTRSHGKESGLLASFLDISVKFNLFQPFMIC